MKKHILTALCAALLFSACGQKGASTQETQPKSEQAESGNDYAYLNPTQNDGKSKREEDLSGKVIALTSDQFLEIITELDPAKGLRYKGNTPCMVDFYADWCRPCMQLKPATERLAEKYKGRFIIYKVNVDKANDICHALEINSIPTLFFFKPNTQPAKMVGAPSEAELDKMIEEFIEK
jgi:thioredoxin